jgi:proline iminopeptidase
LASWDRTDDLQFITAPTLVLGGRHDTMDPTFLEMMAARLPRGSSYICENGSHMAMYDDQESYFEALLGFLSSLGLVGSSTSPSTGRTLPVYEIETRS